jgi:hypothetical protein
MAEQVVWLRGVGVPRPGPYDSGREQAGQREAGGDEDRHRGSVTGRAVDGDQ